MQNLAYTEKGKGSVVVLLHGFCESKAIWKDFMNELSKYFRVIAIDLGGFGESANALPEPCSMETMAEQVFQTIQNLQVSQAAFVGHSMGGYVALALAEKYPTMLEKLCLFHSTALADSPEKKENRNKVIEFVQKAGVEAFISNFVKPLFYEGRWQELQQEIHFLEEIGKETPLKTIVSVLAAMRDRKSRLDMLAKVNFPVFYIIGKQDTAVVWESYQEQLQKIPKAQTLILDNTGHVGMLERPQETLQALKDFLIS
ncbi:alpha/beta fold hydrolase [Raineya sp.]|jgi:pimeloyl-ACP methyl ester carboxylesterase